MAERVCRRWHYIAAQDELWRIKCQEMGKLGRRGLLSPGVPPNGIPRQSHSYACLYTLMIPWVPLGCTLGHNDPYNISCIFCVMSCFHCIYPPCASRSPLVVKSKVVCNTHLTARVDRFAFGLEKLQNYTFQKQNKFGNKILSSVISSSGHLITANILWNSKFVTWFFHSSMKSVIIRWKTKTYHAFSPISCLFSVMCHNRVESCRESVKF